MKTGKHYLMKHLPIIAIVLAFTLTGCLKEFLVVTAVTGWAAVEIMTTDEDKEQVVHEGKVEGTHCYQDACFVNFESGSMYRIEHNQWSPVSVGDNAKIIMYEGKAKIKKSY
jgi:hypothetical protein